ncbi:hypothetical protein Cva_00850 [Caedimonas varicaedens]|uniref:Uncharacterized protein n=1 Tax=Caedimonas varicaedens TaxID=1629334 RepID=A0A0K8MCK8_9PROT|nr:hypothetical protein Cva_00850 [Caedimonas varicaedens]
MPKNIDFTYEKNEVPFTALAPVNSVDPSSAGVEFHDGTQWLRFLLNQDILGTDRQIVISIDPATQKPVISISQNPVVPGDTVIDSAGFLTVPVGVQSQRPTEPKVGMIRFSVPDHNTILSTPTLPGILSPIGTGTSDTQIDYTKFIGTEWTLSTFTENSQGKARLSRYSREQTINVMDLSAVSELDFSELGLTLRWASPADLSGSISCDLTFKFV